MLMHRFCTVQSMKFIGASTVESIPLPYAKSTSQVFDFVRAIAVLSILFSLAAAGCQLATTRKRTLGTTKNGYIQPNTRLLGCVMQISYASLALAACDLVQKNLRSNRNLPTLVYFAISLPTGLFLWAWLHATGPMFAFYKSIGQTGANVCSALVIRPSYINYQFFIFPITVVLLTSGCVGVLLKHHVTQMHSLAVEGYSISRQDPTFDFAAARNCCHTAATYYRVAYAIWATSFIIIITCYIIYESVYQRNLAAHVAYLDVSNNHGPPVRVYLEKGARAERDASKVLSTLRRNMQLRGIQLIFFLSIHLPLLFGLVFRAVEGFYLFTDTRVWGGLLAAEILLANLCACGTCSLSIWRGINVYLALRRKKRRALNGDQSVVITVQTDYVVDCLDEDELRMDYSPSIDVPVLHDSPSIPKRSKMEGDNSYHIEEEREEIKEKDVLDEDWRAPAEWGEHRPHPSPLSVRFPPAVLCKPGHARGDSHSTLRSFESKSSRSRKL